MIDIPALILGILFVGPFVLALVGGRRLLNYSRRSLWTRKMTTLLTLVGVTLVVFVFAAVLMLASGLQETLVDTGSEGNAIMLRKSANSELMSQIGREAANVVAVEPGIAPGASGKPVLSNEVVVVINLLKRESNDMGNVSVRGVSPEAFTLRPQVNVNEGRNFRFGTNEIIVGSNLAARFNGCEIGRDLAFGGTQWRIVGHFDAAKSGFESEIWGDVDQFMPAFGRPVFSSLTVRLADGASFDELRDRLAADPRTQYIEIKREQAYYREQSEFMAKFIRILGLIVTFIFSIGAMIGAMITMYGAIANRTVEIGTLRSLGFKRRNILAAFLVESVILSLIGAAAGILLASAMSLVRISTLNFGTFSELAFGFRMSPDVVYWTAIFAVAMGILGGFLPAVRASRLGIVNALRST